MLQKLTQRLPGADIWPWLAPLGQSMEIAFGALSIQSVLKFSWKEYRKACTWMGLRSFHMVALAAVFVGAASVTQLVVELKKYHAQDVTGALITIGLLREIGPLTVGLGLCARIAAYIAEEAKAYNANDSGQDFSTTFVLPRLLAVLTVALPLATYGLLIGFISCAMFSSAIEGSAINDFFCSAKQALHHKDLVAYFLKLAFVYPTIAIFAGCVSGLEQSQNSFSVAANAVTATFICGLAANLVITIALFLI